MDQITFSKPTKKYQERRGSKRLKGKMLIRNIQESVKSKKAKRKNTDGLKFRKTRMTARGVERNQAAIDEYLKQLTSNS